ERVVVLLARLRPLLELRLDAPSTEFGDTRVHRRAIGQWEHVHRFDRLSVRVAEPLHERDAGVEPDEVGVDLDAGERERAARGLEYAYGAGRLAVGLDACETRWARRGVNRGHVRLLTGSFSWRRSRPRAVASRRSPRGRSSRCGRHARGR